MQASAIFQRTESGRTEIKTKMHGLTQSERLALIVVDGVTPYLDLRQKLKGLTDERFDRALNKLLQKTLIFELLLPTGKLDNDEFDAATVDRFLHQDPLDPVTIISFDVEDELGIDIQAEGAAMATLSVVAVPKDTGMLFPPSTETISPSSGDLLSVVAQPRIVTVDIYLPLEKVKTGSPGSTGSTARTGTAGNRQGDAGLHNQSTNPSAFDSRRMDRSSMFGAPSRKIQWGQLMIAIGIVVIVISIVFKLSH